MADRWEDERDDLLVELDRRKGRAAQIKSLLAEIVDLRALCREAAEELHVYASMDRVLDDTPPLIQRLRAAAGEGE